MKKVSFKVGSKNCEVYFHDQTFEFLPWGNANELYRRICENLAADLSQSFGSEERMRYIDRVVKAPAVENQAPASHVLLMVDNQFIASASQSRIDLSSACPPLIDFKVETVPDTHLPRRLQVSEALLISKRREYQRIAERAFKSGNEKLAVPEIARPVYSEYNGEDYGIEKIWYSFAINANDAFLQEKEQKIKKSLEEIIQVTDQIKQTGTRRPDAGIKSYDDAKLQAHVQSYIQDKRLDEHCNAALNQVAISFRAAGDLREQFNDKFKSCYIAYRKTLNKLNYAKENLVYALQQAAKDYSQRLSRKEQQSPDKRADFNKKFKDIAQLDGSGGLKFNSIEIEKISLADLALIASNVLKTCQAEKKLRSRSLSAVKNHLTAVNRNFTPPLFKYSSVELTWSPETLALEKRLQTQFNESSESLSNLDHYGSSALQLVQDADKQTSDIKRSYEAIRLEIETKKRQLIKEKKMEDALGNIEKMCLAVKQIMEEKKDMLENSFPSASKAMQTILLAMQANRSKLASIQEGLSDNARFDEQLELLQSGTRKLFSAFNCLNGALKFDRYLALADRIREKELHLSQRECKNEADPFQAILDKAKAHLHDAMQISSYVLDQGDKVVGFCEETCSFENDPIIQLDAKNERAELHIGKIQAYINLLELKSLRQIQTAYKVVEAEFILVAGNNEFAIQFKDKAHAQFMQAGIEIKALTDLVERGASLEEINRQIQSANLQLDAASQSLIHARNADRKQEKYASFKDQNLMRTCKLLVAMIVNVDFWTKQVTLGGMKIQHPSKTQAQVFVPERIGKMIEEISKAEDWKNDEEKGRRLLKSLLEKVRSNSPDLLRSNKKTTEENDTLRRSFFTKEKTSLSFYSFMNDYLNADLTDTAVTSQFYMSAFTIAQTLFNLKKEDIFRITGENIALSSTPSQLADQQRYVN
ncbi:hypothetical protein [Aquicella lusitana]|uniref:Uncharacterized protein n=1 Tax=Aquicella lusitana TaxID=254246 RepID=A0A370G8D9_9COXI|nr:hypothetical protein [Aquicella lusitana]RDI40065.1 hypothetical protein C8D86_12415 [Aquicella lusitana]VVC72345.1 hypothetical protein AQULUS_00550 [Aquicella lusitana]